jgi:hypothetical protein
MVTPADATDPVSASGSASQLPGADFLTATTQTARRTLLQFVRTPQLLVMPPILAALFMIIFRYRLRRSDQPGRRPRLRRVPDPGLPRTVVPLERDEHSGRDRRGLDVRGLRSPPLVANPARGGDGGPFAGRHAPQQRLLPIVGARTRAHLGDTLDAVELELTDDGIERLDQAAAIEPGSPHGIGGTLAYPDTLEQIDDHRRLVEPAVSTRRRRSETYT